MTTTTPRTPALALTGFFAILALAGCQCEAKEAESPPEPAAEAPTAPEPGQPRAEPVAPLPTDLEVDMKKVALGRRLYHDARLSGDGTVSCATCHSLDHGGAEPRPTSIGINGQVGPINAPTVLNSFFNVAQFWNGRAPDLAAQAAGPMENPIEMGGAFHDIIATLEGLDEYMEQFDAVYGPDSCSKENVVDAIAEYEKSLLTPSRFDAWLLGDEDAITEAEKAGYETFKLTGCIGCHNGVGIGGSIFKKVGEVNDYFALRGGEITEADLGRFTVTDDEADRHVFKVPTLRNVAETAPYFHDGSRETLEDAVKTMAYVQLGKELTDEEIGSIVTFLRSLTGELPEHARLMDGELPESALAPEPPASSAAAEDEGA